MSMPFCPKHGRSHPNCKCDQGTIAGDNYAKGGEVKMSNKLQMAYNARKSSGKSGGGRVGCVDCMAKGGRCTLHSGGDVENEKLHPDAMAEGGRVADSGRDGAVRLDDAARKSELDFSRDESMEMPNPNNDQSSIAKLAMATGGLVDAIMKDRERRKMAEGGLVDADASPDYDKRVDLEPVHTREDEEHELTSPSLDDESLVGQILSERKMKRRG